MTNDVSLQSSFQNIYDKNEWGQGSGPGSSPTNTIEYRAFLSRFIAENGIHNLTDLGCGDWQFSRFMDWSNLDYTGFDVVPTIVERNQRLFALPRLAARADRNHRASLAGRPKIRHSLKCK